MLVPQCSLARIQSVNTITTVLVKGLLALQIEPLQACWHLIGFPPVLRLETCVSAIPRAAVSFPDGGGVPPHWGREGTEKDGGDGERHPWLFTKHSLLYLREAVRGPFPSSPPLINQ